MPEETSRAAGPIDRFAERHQDVLLPIGRLMIGWIFVQSGWRKVMDPNAFAATLVPRGVPEGAATVLGWIGSYVEFIGGLLVMFGLGGRYAALLMLLFTIIATIIGHRFWEHTNPAEYRSQHSNFFKNLTMAGGLVVLYVAGPGRIALDRLLRR